LDEISSVTNYTLLIERKKKETDGACLFNI